MVFQAVLNQRGNDRSIISPPLKAIIKSDDGFTEQGYIFDSNASGMAFYFIDKGMHPDAINGKHVKVVLDGQGDGSYDKVLDRRYLVVYALDKGNDRLFCGAKTI